VAAVAQVELAAALAAAPAHRVRLAERVDLVEVLGAAAALHVFLLAFSGVYSLRSGE
jgi:hypothetical protein